MFEFQELCSEYSTYDNEEGTFLLNDNDSREFIEHNDEHRDQENTVPQTEHLNTSIMSDNSIATNSSSHDTHPDPRQPLMTVPLNFQCNGTEVNRERNTRPGYLRDILEKDPNCRAVVLKYDASNSLTKNLRNRLVRFIIDHEKKSYIQKLKSDELIPEFSISASKFLFFAEEIKKTFPREVTSTYYSPFRRQNGVAINASGKLWWHYDYAKRKMFNDGILEKRGKKTNLPLNDVMPASCIEKLEYLRTKVEPWSEVQKIWTDTFEARRYDLIHNHLSVKNLIETYACLQVKDALSLFACDFATLHPPAVGRLQATWEFATDHLVEKLNALVIKDLDFLELRLKLKTTNSDSRTAVLLSLLPYLIPPRRPGRKRKSQENVGNNNPEIPRILTFPEIKESFFIHIPNVVELETILTTGISHTSRLALQHQPIPIIVGPFDNISACYILLENILYETSSILHAFESTIQICYAVHCEYPLNARSIWVFLQQAFLNIKEATDKPSNDVTALIGEIETIIKDVSSN